VRDRLRSVGIVEPENRGLGKEVRRAKTRRMLGVAFNLRRPAFVALDEKSYSRSSERHRRRVEQGLPRDNFLRLPYVGHDGFIWLPGTGAHAGEGQGGSHELEEASPTHRIEPLRCVLRELAMQELLEFGRFGDRLEAAPVIAAAGSLEPGAERLDVVAHEPVTDGTPSNWCCP